MLGTMLGVTPAQAKRIFGLNYENRRFFRDDGSTYVQPVFTVDNSPRATQRFMRRMDRMLRRGDISQEQAQQAGATFNLLADPKTTELMIVESSKASFRLAGPIGDDMSIPPEEQPVFTIAQNDVYNRLQADLPDPDPSTFQAGLANADGGNLSYTDRPTGLPVAAGFFNESSSSPNAGRLRGILIIDTRQGPDFTFQPAGGQVSDADRDRMGAGVIKAFESGMNNNGGAGGTSYGRTIETDNR
jgi:hypothetical protein